jgi:hypothetical protein
MMHPDTRVQFISDEVGHGVVATAFIPKGTITWVQDPLDQVFSVHRRAELPAHFQALLEYFAFKNARDEMILCWDHARYVNHSFKSNCLSTAYDFEVAVRDIQLGEQLTDDYGYLNLDSPWRPMDEGTRRKWVHPDDPVRCARQWDRQIEEAMRAFDKVDQPLRPWVASDFWLDWQEKRGPLKSTSDLLCHRRNVNAGG